MDEATSRAARVFDAWALEGRDEGMAKRHAKTAGPVLGSLPLARERSFLDLGCGNAWAAAYAAERGCFAVGVDAAFTMLGHGGALREDVRLVQGDFTRLPFPSSCFDVVFSMEALYYAGDVQAALREAFRVLEPGGELHVLVDYYEENEASHSWPELTGVEMQLLSEPAWRDAFEGAGFEAVGTGRVRVEDEATADWKATVGSLHIHGQRPVG